MTVWLVQWLDRNGRVAAVPFQKPSILRSAGLTREQCEREAWAVEPSGERHSGAGAVLAALSWAIGFPGALRLYYLPGLHQVADAVYGWVARNRSRLPGVTPYCQQHPDDCGAE